MTSSSRQELWDTFCRGTAAGRALFNLYSGDSAGKAAGNSFNERYRSLHQEKLANGWVPSQEPPGQDKQVHASAGPAKVTYPKFIKAKEKVSQVATIPRRKPADVILRQLEEDVQQLLHAPMPAPKGPLLDEQEKVRLATSMQYRGRVPCTITQDTVQVRQRPKPKSHEEELRERFDEVVQEVEERKQFISDMEAAGALTKEQSRQIHAEIADKVRELKRLDALMNGRQQQPAGER